MTLHSRALSVLASCLLLACACSQSLQNSSCDFSTVVSLRAAWRAKDESCQKKLPFELWALMKAEGLEQNSDAQHMRANCIQTTKDVGLLELMTPEGYTMSASLEAAPGDVVSETKHATTYKGATAATFEAFCEDDDIFQVSRVFAKVDSYRASTRRSGRRLQGTNSEAVQAHQVAELITGLKDLGCKRTTGEDQTICVMSDSFDVLGGVSDLQDSGDLPHVEVVKELPLADQSWGGIDEGSAMIEIMYDISSGSNYKFNTAFIGEQTFADDIGRLATREDCDVIVDDIGYMDSAAFRDGPIALAIDEAVDSGSLYFSSAGNEGSGYRFKSDFECTDLFSEYDFTPGCGSGRLPSHVFQPKKTGRYRYLYPLEVSQPQEAVYVHWDSDIGAAGDVAIGLWIEVLSSNELFFLGVYDYESGGKAFEFMDFWPFVLDDGKTPDPFVSYYMQLIHLEEKEKAIDADFLVLSLSGFTSESDGSMFGHPCASKAVAVGAMDWSEGNGPGGAFEDPETSPVEEYSSRGPCIVNGDTRLKPTTTAADSLTTSNPILSSFIGTSASSPVAAAIATVVRAACFPKVVGYDEIMEMLSNYEYTIDYTNDAGGAAETWGAEAGHGIISASQMLGWVRANCEESCPAGPSADPAPTEAQTCPGGIPGINSKDTICCSISCGECAGDGCSSRTGGAEACCRSGVKGSDRYCDETGEAPCIIGGRSTAATPEPAPVEGPFCTGDIVGINSKDAICCPTSCGECGGSGCSGRPGGAESCCESGVKDSDRYCDETGEAPCIIGSNGSSPSPASTCPGGIPGISASDVVCCPIGCNQCGGDGCSTSGAKAGLGWDACCGAGVKESGKYCDETGEAPCIIGSRPSSEAASECSNGLPGFESGSSGKKACCPLECTRCGGTGCSEVGAGAGLDDTDCCVSGVLENHGLCSVTGKAPCKVDNA